MATQHHRVDYFELAVTDMDAAKAFYASAFGWTFQDWGPEYADIQGAGLSGGLRAVSTPPAVGGVLVIIYSDNLDASEKAVVAAGGKVTAKHDFPGGKRFHFSDPSGNDIAIWTKAT